MASSVTRDHHNLRRNLRLNNNYISNDGDNEGLSINDNGTSSFTASNASTGGMAITATKEYTGTTNSLLVSGLYTRVFCQSNIASGQTYSSYGARLINDVTGTNVGTITQYGLLVDVNGNTNGTSLSTGIEIDVSGADTNYGITCASADRQLRLGYDGSSYLDITVADDSHTTLATAESGNIILNPSGDITLKPAGGDIAFHDGTSDIFKFDVATPTFYMYDDADTSGLRDYLSITVGTGGATQITTNDDSASNANLTFTIDGDIEMESLFDDITFKSAGNMYLNSGTSIFLDAESGNCRLTDDSETDNVFTPAHDADITTKKYVDDNIHTIVPTASTTDVLFDGCGVGFDKISYTDATNVTVDFTTGNKAELDMAGGSISGTLSLKFPDVSGNFLLVVKQDGSTRTIAAFATLDSAGNAGNNDGGTGGAIRWAGGSAPDLTDGSNKDDILTFYWDADLEVCYGVATLNF